MKWLVKMRVRTPWELPTEIYSREQEMMYQFPTSFALALVGWWGLEAKITQIDTRHRYGYSQ
jgi:hypothetical protein